MPRPVHRGKRRSAHPLPEWTVSQRNTRSILSLGMEFGYQVCLFSGERVMSHLPYNKLSLAGGFDEAYRTNQSSRLPQKTEMKRDSRKVYEWRNTGN